MQVQEQTVRNLIGGVWKETSTRETFHDISPADTRTTIGTIQLSDVSDVREAFESAQASYAKWAGSPPIERGKLLFKAAEMIQMDINRLLKLLTLEEGKTLSESRGEVQRAADIFRFYGGQAATLKGDTFPASVSRFSFYSVREPLGVISILTPWNFPIAIPSWKITPALVCGNSVVFKPASKTPLIAYELVRILHGAGFPAGVLNFVTGSGERVGDEMVTNENVSAISFTGSYEVGARIYKLRGANAAKMIRIQLEMGGKNPTYVDEQADSRKGSSDCDTGCFRTHGAGVVLQRAESSCMRK